MYKDMKGSGITKGEDAEEDAESLLEIGRIQRKDKGVVGEGTFGRPPRPFNLALHHQQIPDKNAAAANHGRIVPDDEKKGLGWAQSVGLILTLSGAVLLIILSASVDGRLGQSLNVSLLSPYLDSLAGSRFSNGANFAIVGSSTLPKRVPFSLNIQVMQFIHFKATAGFSMPLMACCGNGGPPYNYNVGLTCGHPGSQGLGWADQSVSQSLNVSLLSPYLDSLAGSNFSNGANFAVVGSSTMPKRVPFSLSIQVMQFIHFKATAGSKHWINDEGFRKALYMIDIGQNDLSDSFTKGLSYVQVTERIPSVIEEIKSFSTPLMACCGNGGPPYNFNGRGLCGQPGSRVCDEGSRFVSWDGIHYTEAANTIVASKILSTNYSTPRIPFDFFCCSQSLNVSLLSPYLDSLAGSIFSNGVNFAVASSSTIPKRFPFSLSIQVMQFIHFKATAGSKHWINDEGFRKALYMIDIGQNDLSDSFTKNLSYVQVTERIPSVIEEIKSFSMPLMACCGNGGPPYNFNAGRLCGRPGSHVCDEGSRFVSWDGIHYTEAANTIVASKILSTNYSTPRIPFDFFCCS
ncbi:hypothetical protein ACE6H2_022054 [Prunus campanulata]